MYNSGFLNSLLVICITYVVTVTGSDVITNQSINSPRLFDGQTGEFKLTKLLNIQIGGEHERVMGGDIRNMLLSEIKRGIANEVGGSAESLNSSQPLESYSQKELVAVLRDLYSEISTLKQNMSDVTNYSSSGCLIQSDILAGNSYPVGVSYHRLCAPGALNKETAPIKKYFPKSCKEIQEQGNNVSGVYEIQPKKSEKPLMVLCDMETKGGGWTHIQKRYDGSVDFFLGWREYKFGFGDLESEFWIGLENIYKMTAFQLSELLVEIVDREGNKTHAYYKEFRIGSETEGYTLNTLKGFSGDAGDALAYHLGNKFTTKDFDRDNHTSNCAITYSGAWWYKSCHESNLNGQHINTVLPEHFGANGMHWKGFKSSKYYCYAKSRMLVRPAEG